MYVAHLKACTSTYTVHTGVTACTQALCVLVLHVLVLVCITLLIYLCEFLPHCSVSILHDTVCRSAHAVCCVYSKYVLQSNWLFAATYSFVILACLIFVYCTLVTDASNQVHIKSLTKNLCSTLFACFKTIHMH